MSTNNPELIPIPTHLASMDHALRPSPAVMYNSYAALRDTGLDSGEVSRLLGYRIAVGLQLEQSYTANWARGQLAAARERILLYAEGKAVNGIKPTSKIVFDANCRIQDLAAGETILSRDISESRTSRLSMTASEITEIERSIKTFHISEGVRQDGETPGI